MIDLIKNLIKKIKTMSLPIYEKWENSVIKIIFLRLNEDSA